MIRIKLKYVILIGIALSNFSCSVFQNDIVTDGWTEYNIQSKVLFNKLTNVKAENETKIYGNIKSENDENVGLVLIFKNINDGKTFGLQTDFDGNYSTLIEKGKYDLFFQNEFLLRNIIVEKGDQRRIDFELIIGPETTISVEYPNKRAWRKDRRQRERNRK